jgi:hypothetical protein
VFDYVRSGRELMLYSGARRYARLVRVETFCNLAHDCLLQDYLHEQCVGEPTCRSSRCDWECMGLTACADYLCTTGEHCVLGEEGPECAPNADSQCSTVRCGSERPHCVSSEGETACIAADQCHRHDDCPAGKYCQSEVECSYAPCFSPLVCR